MNEKAQSLLQAVQEQMGSLVLGARINRVGDVELDVSTENLIEACEQLRDDEALAFNQLTDLCGVDYSDYAGGSRDGPRFAVSTI